MRLTEAEVRGALWCLGVNDPWVEYGDYGHRLYASAYKEMGDDRRYFGQQIELKRHGCPTREEIQALADALVVAVNGWDSRR